jgi:hypothetical protein
MKFVEKSIALAALVLLTTGPSYARPLRSTSIPSSLADDEKRLMPKVMAEFYGTFDKGKACWISKPGPGPRGDDAANMVNEAVTDITYCMKPIRLDVIKSTGRKMLFVVAGGQKLDEEGRPQECHGCPGVLGLIVLTPNGANLGVVATSLHEEFQHSGLPPQRNSVTIQRLGPNGAYGWVAKSGDVHFGSVFESAEVYGVIGEFVKLLTTVTSYYSNATGAGAEGPKSLYTIAAKFRFERHSSASSFYPIVLRFSGVRNGRPFHSNYRLVFDKKLLTYLAPNNMPDEIKPYPFVALPEPGLLSLACKGAGYDLTGIIVNFTTRTVQFDFYRHEKITALDNAKIAFGEEKGFIGTIDRVTGETKVKTGSGADAYSLQCKPVEF